MSATPQPARCPTKQRLLHELRRSHAWAVKLTKHEMFIFERGQLDMLVALEQALQEARIKRDNAANTLHKHMVEHGC